MGIKKKTERKEKRKKKEEKKKKKDYNFCLWQYGRLNNMKVLKHLEILEK